MENNDMTFTMIDHDGKEIECDILFTFHSDETNRDYMIYTDRTVDENGNYDLLAAGFNPESEEFTLEPIETDREWEIIDSYLDEAFKELDEELKQENNEE